MKLSEVKALMLTRLGSIKKEGIPELLEYLDKKTDFFSAPASTKYHSNCDYGLMIHSHHVVEGLIKKNAEFKLGLSDDTIYLTGYMHDLCKTNTYKKGWGLTKDPLTGKWIGVAKYEFDEELALGHGEKSVMILQQFIKLSHEEMMMIRWHMGAFVPKEDLNTFSKACDKYTAVSAIFLADMEASRFKEKIHAPATCTVEEYNEYTKQKALAEQKKKLDETKALTEFKS